MHAFPAGEKVLYSALAASCGLSEGVLQRVLRHGMVHHLFTETTKGTVAHTVLTALLARDEKLAGWVANVVGELWPAAAKAGMLLSKSRAWEIFEVIGS